MRRGEPPNILWGWILFRFLRMILFNQRFSEQIRLCNLNLFDIQYAVSFPTEENWYLIVLHGLYIEQLLLLVFVKVWQETAVSRAPEIFSKIAYFLYDNSSPVLGVKLQTHDVMHHLMKTRVNYQIQWVITAYHWRTTKGENTLSKGALQIDFTQLTTKYITELW